MLTFVKQKNTLNLYKVFMQIVYTSSNFKGAVLRAILAILFGIVLITWPEQALVYIVMAIGLVFLITGIAAFVISNKHRGDSNKSVVPVSGIGSMVLGVILICIPLTFAAVLVFMLGLMLVIAAIGQFFTLSLARQMGAVSAVNYFFPILILAAGIIILFNPFETVAGISKGASILFGVMAIFYGLTNFWNNYLLYKYRHSTGKEEKIVKVDRGEADIEDAEYEEVK